MFRNWIDPSEPIALLRRLRRDPLLRRRLLRRLRLVREGRVVSSWAHTGGPPVHYWEIPLIRERSNRLMTGDPSVGFQDHVARRYLAAGNSHRALSLGCGDGGNEVAWASTGRFAAIDSYDISDRRIEAARARAADTPYREILRFHAGDVHRIPLPPGAYDLVVFDHSLHHFSPLEFLLPRIRDTLRAGGLVAVREFVGPSRFQWTDRQLEAVNRLLASFPPRYRARWESALPREPVRRPSRLGMWLSDPSESAESSRILPLLRTHFTVLEERGYGGTILHLLFSGIAHHFIEPDDEARRLLDVAFSTEDALLEGGEIGHDFALVVARKGPGADDPSPA